jgi:uncharacterized protein YndB with AHSA1/START domain
MVDISQDLPIKSSVEKVFAAISTAAGLDQWWTKRSAGQPILGHEYELWFAPEFDWRAVVTKSSVNKEFELTMTRSDADWAGTRVGFQLEPRPELVWVRFQHSGWPTANEHYRISSHCWAMYLRILRRYLEYGESVTYDDRLSV